EVGLEDGQPVRVLVGVPVRLPEPLHEAREVALRVQLQLVLVVAAADHLPDQGLLLVAGDGHRRRDEEEEAEEEEEATIHRGIWGCFACLDWLLVSDFGGVVVAL
uniref:Uncharacterized protein n=1 Tax=Oryza brachyantha TaxID=4533 RepID=J3LCT1_ORYBR